LVSQFLNRTRTRSSGTSSRSSGSSRSSSSRSSSYRSSFCVCSTKQRQHDAHQERPAQSNVHARPRDARVESAQVNRPRACMRLPVARHLCWQAAHRPMSRQPCTCACMCATHEVGRFASVLASHPSRIVTSTSIVCKAQSMCAGKARRTRAKPRHRNPSARHASLVKVKNLPAGERVKTLVAPLRVARLLSAPPLQSHCRLAARLASRLAARLTVQYATVSCRLAARLAACAKFPSIRIKHASHKWSRSCAYIPATTSNQAASEAKYE
jgi:hypothetical protein